MSDPVDTLDAADWAGTETLTVTDARRHDDVASGGESLYRYLNGLDVDVTIAFEVTHGEDSGYTDAEQTNSRTVAAGTTAGDTLTEPWGRVRLQVTPAANPTSGSLRIVKEGP